MGGAGFGSEEPGRIGCWWGAQSMVPLVIRMPLHGGKGGLARILVREV
jgi:hypothetical protein